MAVVVLIVLLIAWWVAWWGNSTLEVRGLAPRLEAAIDRRYAVRDRDGLAMAAARGAWAGFATFCAIWGGFCLPFAAITLVVWAFGGL